MVRNGWLQGDVPYWRGKYDQAAAAMQRARDANGVSLAQLPRRARSFVGHNLALAGDYSEALEMLAEWLPNAAEIRFVPLYGVDPYQFLAWAYSQTGMPDMAREPLEIVEQWFLQLDARVQMMNSADLYAAARNAALMDDREMALDRLQQAVAAGWRGFYINNHDPRWGPLRNDPRYQALMAEVKADVDRQRAVVEEIDAEEDFQALLDKVRENRKSTAGENPGER